MSHFSQKHPPLAMLCPDTSLFRILPYHACAPSVTLTLTLTLTTTLTDPACYTISTRALAASRTRLAIDDDVVLPEPLLGGSMCGIVRGHERK